MVLVVSVQERAWSDDPSSFLQAGINAYQSGKYDEAKTSFTQLLNDSRWSFVALYNLGNIAVRQKHIGEALAYYKLALKKKPHDQDTRVNLRLISNNIGAAQFGKSASNLSSYVPSI